MYFFASYTYFVREWKCGELLLSKVLFESVAKLVIKWIVLPYIME